MSAPRPKATQGERARPLRRWAIVAGLVALVASLAWFQTRSGITRPPPTEGPAATSRNSPTPTARRARITGHVVAAEDAAALPAAIVAVRPIASARSVTHVIADGAGRFALEAGPGTYELRASSAGRAQRRAVRVTVEHDTTVTLRLDKVGGVLHGRVLDAESGPLVGAQVAASSVARPGEAPAISVTGEDGAYRLSLPDGDYVVTAAFDGYVEQERRVAIRGTARPLDFHLFAGATVRGRVVHGDTNTPIRGACVRAATDDDFAGLIPERQRPCAISADDGTYELVGLRPGRVALTAEAPALGTPMPVVVSVSLGATLEGVDLRLVAAHDLRGRVETRDGQALEEIAVVALRPEDGGRVAARAVTDQSGRFTLPSLSPGEYLVRTEPDPRALTSAVTRVATPADHEIALVVDRGVTVTGRVEPASAGAVRIRAVQEAVAIDALGTALTAESALEASVAADGRFRIEGVPPGGWQVVAETDAGEGAARIDVAASDVDGVVIELGQLAELCGHARDQHGAALGAVTVTAMPQALSRSPAAGLFRHARHELARDGVSTDEQGAFCMRGLAPGTYLVVVRDENLALMWTQRHVEDGNLTPITLAPGERREDWIVQVHRERAIVSGRVVDARGRVVADALVTVERAQPITGDAAIEAPLLSSFHPPRAAVSGPAGEFAIEVPAGLRYRVRAEHAPTGRHGTQADVSPGTPATIRVAANGNLRCTAPGARGDCRVRVHGPIVAEAMGHGERCDVTFAELPPGNYTVEARRGSAAGSTRVAIRSDAEATCTVPLADRTRVTARVVDGDGRALPGLPALLMDEASADQVATLLLGGAASRTDGDGRVTWYVAAGPSHLAILSADGQRILHVRAVDVTEAVMQLGEVAVAP